VGLASKCGKSVKLNKIWRKLKKMHDLTHAIFKFFEEDAKSPLKNLST
jgi:hypothetical protein